MFSIMIVEDDKTIASSLETELNKWQYDAFCVQDFHKVLDTFKQSQPQLVLMDINLPTYNGYYWTQEIRKLSEVPIIFITSRSDDLDLVMAIQMGADDFIKKPFALTVALAKVQAMLRRTYDYIEQEAFLTVEDIVLKTTELTLVSKKDSVSLTKNECKILEILFQKKGQFISRDKIITELWESEAFIDDNTLAVNISRLRKKLREIGEVDFIQTKKGGGYAVGKGDN